MAFDFLKKIFKSNDENKQSHGSPAKTETGDLLNAAAEKEEKMPSAPRETPVQDKVPSPPASAEQSGKPAEKKHVSQMSDEELEKELLDKAPELFAHAKTPEMKKMVIDIYRAMLLDNVNVDNEKEVKKWLQKHPEVAQGGSPLPKPQTYKREAPKVGRNDPCPCGSGKKYKKCCGEKQ